MRRSSVLAFILIVSSLLAVRQAEATEIRIKNASPYDFEDLLVAGQFCGQLRSGQMTDYKTFPVAYRTNFVRLKIRGSEYIFQPMDYPGEKPLGPERFIYVIKVLDLTRDGYKGGISIQAVSEDNL